MPSRPTSRLVADRRTHDDEITVFDSTGAAIPDVAAAIVVYEGASAMGAVPGRSSMTESGGLAVAEEQERVVGGGGGPGPNVVHVN